ncbi:MAG TPA: hypothetical protein VKH20_06850 [Solirubrobacterales bacterium]|nr:hypothetical protein [Solirubrobacterales bacterium]
MIRTRLLIKLFGLCALVFAMMGVTSSAQGATWLVLEGLNIVESGEVTAEVDTTPILHSKISGTEFLVECSSIAAVGVNLAAGGNTAKGGKIKFSSCKVKLNGSVSAPCEPISGGTEKGVIVTKPLHAFLYLHSLGAGGNDELIEVVPDEGETYLTLEMGKECSVGTKIPVIGLLYWKDCENALLIHKEKHLFEEGPLTELFVISKTAEHKATLLGSWWVKVRLGGVFRSFAGHV